MFFGLGSMEIAVIFILVILLFPPRELPKLARGAAKAYGSLRRTADDFKRTVMLDDELREPFDEIRGAYSDARWKLQATGRDLENELRTAADEVRYSAQLKAKDDVKSAEDPPGPSDGPSETVNQNTPADASAGSVANVNPFGAEQDEDGSDESSAAVAAQAQALPEAGPQAQS